MCATKSTNSCYVSNMWVVIHFDDSFDSFASSPLLYVTNIFSVCVLYLFVVILRSLKATLVSVCIRQEKCPMHVVCNFNKGYAPENTLCIVFKDMKWFIITVQN